MSKLRLIAAVLAAGLLSGGVVHAQSRQGGGAPATGGSQPTAPTSPTQSMGQGSAFPRGPQFRDDIINQAWRYHLTRLTGYRNTKETDRANRVAALIDHGRCVEARQLADREHDTLMAARVPAVCAARRAGQL